MVPEDEGELTELFRSSGVKTASVSRTSSTALGQRTSLGYIDGPRQSAQSMTTQLATYIDFNLLAVRIFNGRIIALDPDILDELSWTVSSILPAHSRSRGAYQ